MASAAMGTLRNHCVACLDPNAATLISHLLLPGTAALASKQRCDRSTAQLASTSLLVLAAPAWLTAAALRRLPDTVTATRVHTHTAAGLGDTLHAALIYV